MKPQHLKSSTRFDPSKLGFLATCALVQGFRGAYWPVVAGSMITQERQLSWSPIKVTLFPLLEQLITSPL